MKDETNTQANEEKENKEVRKSRDFWIKSFFVLFLIAMVCESILVFGYWERKFERDYYEAQFKDTCELSQTYRHSYNVLAKYHPEVSIFTQELNCTDLMLK